MATGISTDNEDIAAQARQRMQKANERVNPPARLVMTDPAHLLAFFFGCGLSKYAPGTVGSAATIPLFLLLSPLQWELYLAALAVVAAIGVWACSESSRRLGVHDHPGIVIDEVVGMLITLLPIAGGFWGGQIEGPLWLWLYAGFLTFRAFDIVKPPPIGWLDRQVHGGLGIMLDDVVAGLMAAAVMAAIAAPQILF